MRNPGARLAGLVGVLLLAVGGLAVTPGAASAGPADGAAAVAPVRSADPGTDTHVTRPFSCPAGYFCAYPQPNFAGYPRTMARCSTAYGWNWTGYGSWFDDTTGSVTFRDVNGQVLWHWGIPEENYYRTNYDWTPVYSVTVC